MYKLSLLGVDQWRDAGFEWLEGEKRMCCQTFLVYNWKLIPHRKEHFVGRNYRRPRVDYGLCRVFNKRC